MISTFIDQSQPAPEPLIDAKVASAYLGFAAITVLRMARAGKLPTIAFPIGKTGKYLYKFKASQLEAYVESLTRLPKVA
jgi:hypothetical protein